MANLIVQLHDYRLTTAQIFYHLPDHPALLQSYTWQEYDIAPKYPRLIKFLEFWRKELDGKLHSVYVASKDIITSSDPRFFDYEFMI